MVEASSAEEAAQQGNEGGADQSDTAAGHQLFDGFMAQNMMSSSNGGQWLHGAESG